MLLKYESSVEDLEYLKDVQSDVNSDFSSAIAALKRPDLFDNKTVEQMAEESQVEEEIDVDRDPAFKKLFRKVVIITHPDKFTEDMSARDRLTKQELYDRAVKANDSYNWAELITVAIKLEIELGEEYHSYVNDMQGEVEKIQKQINDIENSIAWKWYHSPDDQRDQILQAYVSHMEKVVHGPKRDKRLILGVGHPRTGTGFTAKMLSEWGLDVGHEKLGKDGMVAWQLAIQEGPWPFIDDIKEPFEYQHLIYNVRNPKTSIPSIVFTEDTNSKSVRFRNQHGVQASGNRVEQAILSILHWDSVIRKMGPNVVYRIEDQSSLVYDYLKSNGIELNPLIEPGVVNDRQHPGLSEIVTEFKSVRPSLKMKINDFCVRYGYDLLY